MRRTKRDRQRDPVGPEREPRALPVTAAVSWRGHGAPRAAAGSSGRFEMTVGAFLARQRSGALYEGPRAELVDGKVVPGSPLDPSEAAALVSLTKAFTEAGLADLGVELLPWAPVRLGPIDLVRAALVLLPGPAFSDAMTGDPSRLRRRRDPGAGIGGSFDPASALLLVETVRSGGEQHDRLARYATAGVREVWLLDVRRGWVESFRSPWRREFRSRTLWYPGELVPLASLPEVSVEALVPP